MSHEKAVSRLLLLGSWQPCLSKAGAAKVSSQQWNPSKERANGGCSERCAQFDSIWQSTWFPSFFTFWFFRWVPIFTQTRMLSYCVRLVWNDVSASLGLSFSVCSLVSHLVFQLVWDAVSAFLLLGLSPSSPACLRSCVPACVPFCLWAGLECCVRLLAPVLSSILSSSRQSGNNIKGPKRLNPCAISATVWGLRRWNLSDFWMPFYTQLLIALHSANQMPDMLGFCGRVRCIPQDRWHVAKRPPANRLRDGYGRVQNFE